MDMDHRLERLLTRRTVLGGAFGVIGAGMLRHGSGRSRQDDDLQACLEEPAADMLVAFRSGLGVYPSVMEIGPQPDWLVYEHPSALPPRLIPPGWTPIAAWADTFSSSGEPFWVDAPMILPQLSLSRVVSPDGRAQFEFFAGTIGKIMLTTQQGAYVAQQSVLGSDPDLQPVCAFDEDNDQLGSSWLTVDHHGRNVLLTYGNVYPAGGFTPSTVINSSSIYGPRRKMEDLMYDVFLRLEYQFMGGPLDVDPTPTP
jgi:hypothetical protein